jgi:hypothetical protein
MLASENGSFKTDPNPEDEASILNAHSEAIFSQVVSGQIQ